MNGKNLGHSLQEHQQQAWKFVALSESQARGRTFSADYILISIQDPNEPPVALPEPPHCRGILRMQFDDITARQGSLTLFSREQTSAILDFVEEHKREAALIACHCKMGMCRSPAVLAALAEVMGGDDAFLRDRRGRPKYRPNRYVYDLLVSEGRRHPLGR